MEECDGSGAILTMPYDSDYGLDVEPCPGCRQCVKWTTKDGRCISVADLDSDHLVNIVRMLLRSVPRYRMELEHLGNWMLDTLQGEMAIESVEADLAYLEEEDDEEIISGALGELGELLFAEIDNRHLREEL